MDELDDFDTALLRELQVNNRLTSEALAERVGLSPTACQRRVKRLRETGAIQAEVAVVSPDAAGKRVTLIVEIELERGRADIVDNFKREVQSIPEIQQCYYVTGKADFVLIVTARDMAEYEQLTRKIFFGNPNIQHFTTIVVMDSVKLGLEIPL
jgi:Lrp/AsnC family leucine-responsive transcriptional regulator